MSLRPQILAFDIFGTVVDWHGSIVRELASLAPAVDGPAFARAWRAGYQPAMQRVRSGERGWVALDTLHREILDRLLPHFGLQGLDEAARARLNSIWHRLDPWPEVRAGLQRLRAGHTLCTLSNGNLGLLIDLARHGDLPWHGVLSAEVFQAYKPDPRVYRGVAELFGLPPQAVMLVAAHEDDLVAARRCGLQTAYIERPHEFGADAPKPVRGSPEDTLHARDLLHLADLLGA
ncbi:haloacid dehalogenase type II [Piscinibacter sp. Jin2]|uniref:(S)-2-haloacid dehalogenase n=1 Tax=Aquariibacter lacus TaxID=2801332 RepID=A0A9X1BRU2_9BURK|nr:haloacid dehalogenase type II [Piscinibacter lacus]MBL0719958.1 haloacid dehalogenase type II [Piscinibacter lacus]